MKKSIFAIVLLAIVIVLTLFGCANRATNNKQTTIKLYFANADKNELALETRTIPENNDLLKDTMTALLKGPNSPNLVSIIPKGTKLREISLSDDTIMVDLSKDYYNQSHTDELLARYSIANTLFEIESVKKVLIFIEGVELKNSSGEAVGEISKTNVITKPNENTTKNTSLTLYFPDSEALKLEPEKRTVPIVDNSNEKTVITELMKGPNNQKELSVIPSESKLISIETKDEICFVNFSNEFITKHNGGSTGEMMTVYSIVNSLTELENINKVQFLIEGNKLAVFSHMAFNEPLSRNNDIISEEGEINE